MNGTYLLLRNWTKISLKTQLMMQRMMQGCTYPSVLIDDLYKTNRHFSLLIMAACDPYVHSWHTPEIITTISNTWSATHRMYITQGRDHWDPHTWCHCDKWGRSHTSWQVYRVTIKERYKVWLHCDPIKSPGEFLSLLYWRLTRYGPFDKTCL